MPENRPEIVSKNTIRKGNFLRFVLTTYIDSSGKKRKWEYFERINCNGIVAIVPVTDNNEFILIRQYRPPVNSYVIEFPAGLNDKGGTLEKAAERELLEETGYSAKDLILLAEGPMSSGASGDILTVYLAKGLEFQGIGQRDETEDIEVLKFPIDGLETELYRLKSEGNHIDLKIFGFAEMARKFL